MARPKKNNLEDLNIAPEIKTGAIVKITSINENYYFGIYWLHSNKQREFTIEEFEKNKLLCKDFEEKIKKGKLKIEY